MTVTNIWGIIKRWGHVLYMCPGHSNSFIHSYNVSLTKKLTSLARYRDCKADHIVWTDTGLKIWLRSPSPVVTQNPLQNVKQLKVYAWLKYVLWRWQISCGVRTHLHPAEWWWRKGSPKRDRVKCPGRNRSPEGKILPNLVRCRIRRRDSESLSPPNSPTGQQVWWNLAPGWRESIDEGVSQSQAFSPLFVFVTVIFSNENIH